MPLAEEIAPFDDFADQLFGGDRRPFVLAALAGALQRRQDAEAVVNLVEHRVAAGAGGGTVLQAALAVAGGPFEALADRRLIGEPGIAGEGIVGIAGGADHPPALLVDLHPHPALGGAADAHGAGDGEIGVDRDLAGGVDRHLRRLGIAVDRVFGRRPARGQAAGGADGVLVTERRAGGGRQSRQLQKGASVRFHGSILL